MQLSIPHPAKSVRDVLSRRYLQRHLATSTIRLTVPHHRGDLDLGTYPSQSYADAALAAIRPHLELTDPWPAIWELQRAGVIAPDAYPSHVKPVVAGGRFSGYVGKQKVGGDEVESRVFQLPNSAHVTLGKSVRSLSAKLDAELNWVRQRFPRDPDLPKYLRFTKGHALQARPWICVFPGWETGANLGLWSRNLFGGDRHSQIAFGRHAAFTFVKMLCGPPARDVWDVIQEMQGMKHMGLQLVRSHVLPPRVKRTGDGRFVGRVRQRGEVVWESPAYSTPGEAWSAVKGWQRLRVLKQHASKSVVERHASPSSGLHRSVCRSQ